MNVSSPHGQCPSPLDGWVAASQASYLGVLATFDA